MTSEESETKIIEGHKLGHQKEREDILGEHKFSDLGQLILLTIFTILLTLDSFFFHFSTLFTDYIPLYVSIPIGCVLLLIAVFLAFKGLKQVFSEVRDPPEVIKTGVFRYTRHPIYLAAILLYLGLSIITLSLASLGFLIVVIIPFYNYIASYEERLLLQFFGEQYKQYMNETRKWFPFPKIGKTK